MSFENKVVVITGAGSGIGEATALHFAKLSAKLSLLDINAETLQRVTDECEKLSKYKTMRIVVDLTKDEKVKEAVDKTVEQLGGIDVVVNSVGITAKTDILNIEFISSYDKVLNVNLRSYVVVTHYAAPALVKSKGCVINICSIYNKLVEKNFIPYTTSKAAVKHFTRNAALELADKGVRVNCISPGMVKTNLLINSGFSEEDIKKIKSIPAPLKHILNREDIADLVGYLASDKALSITGTDFTIDSGHTLLGALIEDKE